MRYVVVWFVLCSFAVGSVFLGRFTSHTNTTPTDCVDVVQQARRRGRESSVFWGIDKEGLCVLGSTP